MEKSGHKRRIEGKATLGEEEEYTPFDFTFFVDVYSFGLENSDIKDKLSPTNGQPRLPGMPSISFGKALARSKASARTSSSSRTNPTTIITAMLTSISLIPSKNQGKEQKKTTSYRSYRQPQVLPSPSLAMVHQLTYLTLSLSYLTLKVPASRDCHVPLVSHETGTPIAYANY